MRNPNYYILHSIKGTVNNKRYWLLFTAFELSVFSFQLLIIMTHLNLVISADRITPAPKTHFKINVAL